MSKRWLSTLLLSVSAASLLFTSCRRQMSSDAPLPTSYYPSVIINSDNNVIYAINPATGVKNWSFSMPPTPAIINPLFRPSPLLYNEMVYMASISSDTLYKINSKTGLLVKKMVVTPLLTGSFFTVVATPIAHNGVLFIAATNDTLYAIDTGTGVAKWKYGASAPLMSSPTVYNGNVYCATSDGHVFSVNESTGPASGDIPVWDYPGPATAGVPIAPSIVPPSFLSSISICPPFLYVGSATDSNMYCFYLTPSPLLLATYTGELSWTYKTGGAINSSPSTFGGVCIFGSNDNKVYCLDTTQIRVMSGGVVVATTAAPRWTYLTTSQINSSPVIDNQTQTVYIGSYDYFLYAINIINGSLKWKFKSTGLIKSSPLTYNGNVYVGSYDGNLYAVDSGTGTKQWSFPIIGNIECSPTLDDFSGNQYNSGISGYTN